MWFVMPMLLTPLFGQEGWQGWFPAMVILPPLFIGGYVAACYAKSRYRASYAMLGALVGLAASLAVFSILTSNVSPNFRWLYGVVMVAGAVVSALGAVCAARWFHRL
jgi:hypothetical protein